MYKKILVSIDGSESSWKALETAKKFAAGSKAELVILNVTFEYTGKKESDKKFNAELEAISHKILAQAKTVACECCASVECLTAKGDVVEQIIAVAAEKGCDLVVVGSRGLTGLKEMILGSVSSKLLQVSKVPVLIAK